MIINRPTSIFARIFFGFAAVMFVFILPVVLMVVLVMQERVKENILKEDRFLAERLAGEIFSKISQSKEVLTLAVHELHGFEKGGGDKKESEERLRNYFSWQNDFEEMAFLDAVGREVFKFSAVAPVLPKDLKNRGAEEIFQKTLAGEIFFGKPFQRAPKSGDYLVEIAAPFEIYPGRHEGVLIGKRNLSDVSSIISEASFSAGKTAYVFDGSGGTIIHSDKIKSINFEDFSWKTPVQAALAGGSGSLVFTDAQKEEYFSGFAFVPGVSWGVATEEKASDALRASNLARDFILLVALSLLLAGFLIFLFISREISAGIENLARSVRLFREFKKPLGIPLVKPTAIKEINFLAESFGEMCFEIRDVLDALNQEKNKLKAIFDNAGEGIFVVDKNEKFLTFNKTAENLLGWNEKEAAGKLESEFLQILDDKKRPVHQDGRCVLNDEWRKGKAAVFNNLSFLKKNGERIVVDLSVAPILDEAKKPTAGIFIFRDVSEFYKIERIKGEFITVASHQLRTPLSAVKWFLELALNEKLGKKLKMLLKSAYEGNERIINLLSDLLSVARLEAGEMAPEDKTANLKSLVSQVVAEQKSKIKQKKLKLKIDVAGKEPEFEAKIDEKLLRQVILNLLSNAILYTPAGGNVWISLKREKREISFSVKDTGFGIPRDQQKLVFQKFFRGSNVFKKETQGTGLGLYIAKSILEIFGGEIRFESEENKGTTFWFTLPAAG